MVFSIQTENGALDVYKQDISWEWKNVRFADGLRDQYSTDIEIPKTNNNCNILGISGLLDSPSQIFGNHMQPCLLEVNGTFMDIYLQVVSITDDNITICMYEKTLPTEVREKNIARLFKDNSSTILAWNINTLNAYPNWFYKYSYGSPYDANYAQYHPVLKANTIIDNINNACNVEIDHVSDDWYVMSSKKNVCPENTRQTVEGLYSDGSMHIMGGQHITNDLSFSYSVPDTNKITFNRACSVRINLWVAWKSKNTGYNTPFNIIHHKASNNTDISYTTQLRGDLYINYVDTNVFNIDIEKDDTLTFFISTTSFDSIRCIADMSITNYEITEEDYDNELEYVNRVPRLLVYSYNANQYINWWFDATTYNLDYKKRNESGTKHKWVNTSWTSFAWFGYYANLEDLTVSQFLWGLCWLMGKKTKIENGHVSFVDPTDNIILEKASITKIDPASDNFGIKNYIRYDNQEYAQPITVIDNEWLEADKDLHKSPFGYISNISNFVGEIKQYEDFKYDSETGQYSCKFNETGFLVWWHVTQSGGFYIENEWIRDIPLHNMGLDKITQTMEVSIESFDSDVTDKDYVYLDGRKFLVVEGDMDMNTKQSTLTALLVPTE